MSSSQQRVLLNVGGVRFETTVSTLCALPNSLLGRMFAPDNVALRAPAADGAYFFDRSGRLFDYVLQVHRTGSLVILPDEHPDAALLLEEYEYWQVGGDVRAAMQNAYAEQRAALFSRVEACRANLSHTKEHCEWIVSGDAANVWTEMLRTALSLASSKCLHLTISSAGVMATNTAKYPHACCDFFAPASMFDLLSTRGSETISYAFAYSQPLIDLLCTTSASYWRIDVADTSNGQTKRAALSVYMFDSSGECMWNFSDQCDYRSTQNTTLDGFSAAMSTVRVDSKTLQNSIRHMHFPNRHSLTIVIDPVQNQLEMSLDIKPEFTAQSKRVQARLSALPRLQESLLKFVLLGMTCNIDCSVGDAKTVYVSSSFFWNLLVDCVKEPSTTTFCASDYPRPFLVVREFNDFSGAQICICLPSHPMDT